MQDILENLADDIAKKTAETCAKVAEIHRVPLVGGMVTGSFVDGYNTAVKEIAAKIRELLP